MLMPSYAANFYLVSGESRFSLPNSASRLFIIIAVRYNSYIALTYGSATDIQWSSLVLDISKPPSIKK